eukprot:1774048-Prymnesium_polylepis.1
MRYTNARCATTLHERSSCRVELEGGPTALVHVLQVVQANEPLVGHVARLQRAHLGVVAEDRILHREAVETQAKDVLAAQEHVERPDRRLVVPRLHDTRQEVEHAVVTLRQPNDTPEQK